MKTTEYSPQSIARHPDPMRDRYFTDNDYAAARKRTHDRRIEFDHFKKHGKTMPQRANRKTNRGED